MAQQGAARDVASVHCRPNITRTDILVHCIYMADGVLFLPVIFMWHRLTAH